MRKFKFILIVVLIIFYNLSFSQNVAINDNGNTPNSHAILDIDETTNTKGILIPRMTTAQRTGLTFTASEDGLTVYDTDTKTYWLWDGTALAWKDFSAGGGGTGWLLQGNAGTDPANDFIGTTDDVDLHFRINNQNVGQIQRAGYGVAFGYLAANAGLTTGSIAIGAVALLNATGQYNLAVGYSAGVNITSGQNNIAIGNNACQKTKTGSYNIGIGYLAGPGGDAYNYSVAIGYDAKSDDHTIVLGSNDNSSNGWVNVGIGVYSPQSKLDVAGTIRSSDLVSGANGAVVISDANGDMSFINFSGNVTDYLRGDGTWGTKTSNKEIKEMKKQIEELQAIITEMQQEIENLKNK